MLLFFFFFLSRRHFAAISDGWPATPLFAGAIFAAIIFLHCRFLPMPIRADAIFDFPRH